MPVQIAVLVLILLALSIPKFVRTDASIEARVMLRQIYELEQRYFQQNGTYVDFDDSSENARLLGWIAPNGKYRYACTDVTDSTFTAMVSGDIDNDGVEEIWTITQEGLESVHFSAD